MYAHIFIYLHDNKLINMFKKLLWEKYLLMLNFLHFKVSYFLNFKKFQKIFYYLLKKMIIQIIFNLLIIS